MTIYVWPRQLRIKNWRWSVIDPINVSRSLLSGARYVSRHSRRRQIVELEVSVRADHGYGVMEGLISLLEGGENFVRVRRAGPTDITGRRGSGSAWDVSWDVAWDDITGRPKFGTIPGITLSGLKPNAVGVRAGEFVRYNGKTRRLISDCIAGAGGSGFCHIDTALTDAGELPVTVGAEGDGVFEAVSIPSVTYSFASESSVLWTLSEIHADEITDSTELAPWGH